MLYWIGEKLGRLLGKSKPVRRMYEDLMRQEVYRLYLICDYVGIPREIAIELFNAYAYTRGHLTPLQLIKDIQRVVFMESPSAN